ncbi:MAG: iron donor protein CyaY [Burkholderia sp.]|nr:iron donor protein CyaY [Burkholderia sp.]
MLNTEYLNNAEAALAAVERTIDNINDCNHDIDLERTDNVLTLTFEDHSKIIINLQQSMQEIWIASKAGAFHYRYIDGTWLDTRTGKEFFKALSDYVTEHFGLPITFSPCL